MMKLETCLKDCWRWKKKDRPLNGQEELNIYKILSVVIKCKFQCIPSIPSNRLIAPCYTCYMHVKCRYSILISVVIFTNKIISVQFLFQIYFTALFCTRPIPLAKFDIEICRENFKHLHGWARLGGAKLYTPIRTFCNWGQTCGSGRAFFGALQ